MDNIDKNILIIAFTVLTLAIIFATIYLIRFYKKEHFVCPNCGHKWKPTLYKMIVSTNAVEGKIIRCPSCGSKEYVEPVKDETV